jgi:ABC-type branched-subunit amino acid transport system substrate-binding protein
MPARRTMVGVALLAALALVMTGCGSDDDTAAPPAGGTTPPPANRGNLDGTLVLGMLLPQSGDLSAIVKSLTTPIEMAVDEINEAGGVNGKPVRTVLRDDGTKADVASQSLDTLLTADKVDAILGAAASTTTLGIIDKIRTNRVVECSGSNTSAELSVDGGAADGYYFRTAPPDSLQGPALAQLLLEDNRQTITILTRNDSYGTGFGASLQKAFEDGGGEVAVNGAYDAAAPDFKADVAKIVGKNADANVVIGFNDDGGKIVKEMIAQDVGPKDVPLYTADGMQGSSFYKGIDPANPAVVRGIKGTAPAAAPAGVKHPFIAAFAKTGVDTIFSPYYYDCTILVALAAQQSGSDDPGSIKDEILELTRGGTKCQTFKSCLDLLKAGEDIDWDGASGPVNFTDKHEPDQGVYDVWSYGADGKPANVKGVDQITIED